MKLGIKRIDVQARTVGQVKRNVKGAVNPLYGTKSAGIGKALADKDGALMGLKKREFRKQYNKVYRMTGGLVRLENPYTKKAMAEREARKARPKKYGGALLTLFTCGLNVIAIETLKLINWVRAD